MSGKQTAAELAYLTRALKAPTLRDAVPRLAERARDEAWTFEEFLAACLEREVNARNTHGGEGRVLRQGSCRISGFESDHTVGVWLTRE